MILKRKFLLTILFCYPFMAFGLDVNSIKSDISNSKTIPEAIDAYRNAANQVLSDDKYKDKVDAANQQQKVEDNITSATSDTDGNSSDKSKTDKKSNKPEDTRTEEEKKKALEDAEKNYEDKKANEQSTANKTLTALTTAATGIGGMELAMGLSEQKAAKNAEADMDAYIQTFRCTYANGKQVKAGIEEVELPGGNDPELMKLRNEYLALAADLKERKTALGMKPGIESEEIIDKATAGLYDDENVGITGGAYSSLYRAKMLGSEEDQAKIDADKKASKNRVIAGGVLAGAGVIGGIIGNSAINGKLGEAIKKAKEKKEIGEETEKALKVESDALEKLQKCLSDAGAKETNDLSFSNFYISGLSITNINCKRDLTSISGKTAKDLFADSADTAEVLDKLLESFGPTITGKMVGTTLTSPTPTDSEKTTAKNMLDKGQTTAKKRIEDARKKDADSAKSSSSRGGFLSGVADGLADGKASSLLGGAGNLLGGAGGDGAAGGLSNIAGGLLGG